MGKIGRAVALVFLFGMLGQLVSAAPPLPNVVIIYADDMGYGDLAIQNSESKIVTPNGDLKNQTFEVAYVLNPNVERDNTCEIIIRVKMFNRWGNKVFESRDYQNDWEGVSDGRVGAAQVLPAGTYYYVVELVNSGLRPIQGYILLGTEQ